MRLNGFSANISVNFCRRMLFKVTENFWDLSSTFCEDLFINFGQFCLGKTMISWSLLGVATMRHSKGCFFHFSRCHYIDFRLVFWLLKFGNSEPIFTEKCCSGKYDIFLCYYLFCKGLCFNFWCILLGCDEDRFRFVRGRYNVVFEGLFHSFW